MENLVNWYAGKKVLLTGHTGFKGAWMMAMLHTLGASVKGYALEPEYANGLFKILEPSGLGESVIADIRDLSRLQKEVLSYRPEYVFHLAAQPLVRRSYEIPAETFGVNVVGTANLLEAVSRLDNACRVVVVTTDKVYENKETETLYSEDDNLGGYDPYSASKACAELVVSSFRNSFFNPVTQAVHRISLASARAGNVIGGGDWSKDRILPDIVRALRNEDVIEVRNPHAVRPWQHVLEPIYGYLLLGRHLSEKPAEFARCYNFGPLPEGHLKVCDLVETAIAAWGSGSWKDVSLPGSLHEAGLLKLDISRAGRELQWVPKLDARTAIQWTLDWYRQPVEKQASFTFEQINTYLSL